MRIIAGAFRGRRLNAPKDDRIRPTIDRVREAIFSIIFERVTGARVLDLFAGTGAMGLEALSRGADYCVFVDQAAEAIRLIDANIGLCGARDRSRVFHGSADSAIRRLGSENELFDLIFLDPPYGKGTIEKTLETAGTIAGEDALAVAESFVKDRIPDSIGIWQKGLERRYGDTLVSIYSRS